MKKLIDGKMFNTETAEKIAFWSNGLSNDAHEISETLYKTKKDNWFLRGYSGAFGPYGAKWGRNFSAGSDLVSLTQEEAKAWLHSHNEIDLVLRFFPDSVEEA